MLTIKDLPVSDELDEREMSAVRGGNTGAVRNAGISAVRSVGVDDLSLLTEQRKDTPKGPSAS